MDQPHHPYQATSLWLMILGFGTAVLFGMLDVLDFWNHTGVFRGSGLAVGVSGVVLKTGGQVIAGQKMLAGLLLTSWTAKGAESLGGIGDRQLPDRLEDLERDLAAMRLREAEREADVSRIQQHGRRDH